MINCVCLTGRLTDNPQQKVNGDTTITSFTLAVDSGKDKASFFNCNAFNKTAEVIAKATKGSLIGIEGRLNQRTWERQDGSKGSTVEIIVDKFSFLEPKKQQETPDIADLPTNDPLPWEV